MSYCLNPTCSAPKNGKDHQFCQSCQAKLLLRERYRALKPIGQGGFGKTFLAVDCDKPSKPPCVIKQLSPTSQGTENVEEAIRLFNQEAERLESLGKHPQIPELLAHFEQEGQLYLVQEYIDGQNLAEDLADNGVWNEVTIREFLVGLLPVLQFIHENNIIHRDIKPENIIKRRSDKAFVLVDFGISKYFTGTALLKTGVGIGDPRYMPGEQLDGKAIFASDLYSLGLTCLHLLTNISPWQLFDHGEQEWVWRDYLIVPISEGLGKVLDQMVLKATKKRFQRATEILAILQPLSVNKQPVSDLLKATPVVPSIPPAISRNIINQSTQMNVDNKTKVASNNPPKISPVKTEVNSQVIPPQKSHVVSNTNIDIELTPVKLGGYWGYMDKTGEVVIKPWFDSAENFSEGLAKISTNGQNAFINKEGRIISQLFDRIDSFSEGLATVQIKGKYGCIDKKDNIVIEPKFNAIEKFSGGLAKITISQDGGKLQCGYINKKGNIIGELFDEISEFSDGLARVKRNEKYGLIDKNMNTVIKPQCDELRSFFSGSSAFGDNGLAWIKNNGKYGYVNTKFNIIIDPIFDGTEYFFGGFERFVKINTNKKYGLINEKGEIVLQPEFDGIAKFTDGLAIITRCATKNDRIRVLDDNLMVLISESLANQDQKTSCTSRYNTKRKRLF